MDYLKYATNTCKTSEIFKILFGDTFQYVTSVLSLINFFKVDFGISLKREKHKTKSLKI